MDAGYRKSKADNGIHKLTTNARESSSFELSLSSPPAWNLDFFCYPFSDPVLDDSGSSRTLGS
jgi:hypothetical protein